MGGDGLGGGCGWRVLAGVHVKSIVSRASWSIGYLCSGRHGEDGSGIESVLSWFA